MNCCAKKSNRCSPLTNKQKASSKTPAADIAADLIAHNQTRLTAGRTVGPYKIVDLLGAGGMGEVYLAKTLDLGRRVALKLLPAQAIQDDERLHRFEREARAASALNHPNIITIHEIHQAEGAHFIVTEYIEGQTLRQQMSSARITMSEALDVAIQASSALDAAHKASEENEKSEPTFARPALTRLLTRSSLRVRYP